MSWAFVSQCVYCGLDLTAKTLTTDHVIPLSRGGAKRGCNEAPSCKRCNNDKSLLTAAEYFTVRGDDKARKALITEIQRSLAPPVPRRPPPPQRKVTQPHPATAVIGL